jgi:O-antigen ligase
MSKRLELAVDKGDLSGRDTIWEDILPYILDKPIFGLGVDGYFDVISIFFGKFFSPHNVFIEILAYGGLVAFAIFFFFYYRLINISIYLKSKEDYILPIVLLQFILQIFSAGQGLTSKPFWMIYVYIIGTYIYSKSMKKNIIHN